MAVMDILIKATDQASHVMENVGGTSNRVADTLDQNWVKVGAATAAAGAGVMKMTNRSHELNETLRGVSAMTGEAEEDLRSMARGMSDATLSNDDVVASMDRLIKSGIDSQEQFERLIPAFDDFADATGKDIVDSIGLFDETLSALGIPLEEAGDHLDTMTHITEQTDIPLGTLQRNLGRVPGELQKMEFGLDDTTAAIEWFRDQGYTGQEAVREFRRAVEESEGDLDAFHDITGMTADELEEYNKKVGESEGLTEELAEINNESLGIWDRLKAGIDDAMWSMGTFLEPVKDLGPLLMGVGPAMKGMATLLRGGMLKGFLAATKAAWGFTAALLANPITWIIVGIVALVAAIYMLWRNWDTVSDWLSDSWEWIRERAGAMIQGIIDWFSELPGRVWEWLVNTISRILEWRAQMIERAREAASEFLSNVISFLAQLPGRAWEWLSNMIGRVLEWRAQVRDRAIEAGRNLLDGFIEQVRQLPGQVWDWLQRTVSRITDIGGAIWDAASNVGGRIWGGFKSALGISSPSYLEEAMDRIMDKGEEMEHELKGDFGRIGEMDTPDMRAADGQADGGTSFGLRQIIDRLDVLIAVVQAAANKDIKLDLSGIPGLDMDEVMRTMGGEVDEGSRRTPNRVRLIPVD